MESDADAGRYHRYNEPDPEMEDGGDGTSHKPFYATVCLWDCYPGNWVCGGAKFLAPLYYSQRAVFASPLSAFMRPSSLGGGRILRRTLSVCPSVCLSVCPSVPLWSVTWRPLANYNDTLRAA